jgi:hypothetical protein
MENLTNLAGATQRQQEFIADLLAKRVYTLGDIVIDSPKAASALIDALLKAPMKPRGEVRGARDQELYEALCKVQKSKYAVPTAELIMDFFDEKVDNDLLFVEVREYEGTRYIRRLHGAPGSFNRSKLSRSDSLAVLAQITQDTYKYARLFGEHYQCCGKCGAELTDAKSRKLQLGPDCRKAWGF